MKKLIVLATSFAILFGACSTPSAPTPSTVLSPNHTDSLDDSKPSTKTYTVYNEENALEITGIYQEIMESYGGELSTRLNGEKGYSACKGSLFYVDPWSNDKPMEATHYVMWAAVHTQRGITEEEWRDTFTVPYDYNPESDHGGLRDGWVFRQELLEPLVEKYFDISSDYLRTSEFYVPQQKGYTYIFACGVNSPFIYLDEVIKNGDELTLRLVVQGENKISLGDNGEEIMIHLYPDARLLTVKLLPDNKFQFVKAELQPLTEDDTSTIELESL